MGFCQKVREDLRPPKARKIFTAKQSGSDKKLCSRIPDKYSMIQFITGLCAALNTLVLGVIMIRTVIWITQRDDDDG